MFGLVGCDVMFLQPSDAQSLPPPADTYMVLKASSPHGICQLLV